jgi:hypothetical protein
VKRPHTIEKGNHSSKSSAIGWRVTYFAFLLTTTAFGCLFGLNFTVTGLATLLAHTFPLHNGLLCAAGGCGIGTVLHVKAYLENFEGFHIAAAELDSGECSPAEDEE